MLRKCFFIVVLVSVATCYGAPDMASKVTALKAPGTWIDSGLIEVTHSRFTAEGQQSSKKMALQVDGKKLRQENWVTKKPKGSEIADHWIMVTTAQGTSFYSPNLKSLLIDESGNLKSGFHSTLSAGLMPLAGGTITNHESMANKSWLEIRRAEGKSETREYHFKGGLPSEVVVNQFTHDKLTRCDRWVFTKIKSGKVGAEQFTLNAPLGTVVEYVSPMPNMRSAIYTETERVDTANLLAAKFEFAMQEKANCATAAIMAATSMYNVEAENLSQLVAQNGTSMADMRDTLASSGLHTKATKVSLDLLPEDTASIVFLPEKGHYVVLAGIDEYEAWIVDLSSRQFVYRVSRKEFERLSGGMTATTLLVSNKPILPTYAAIPENQLREIVGAALPGRSCTRKYNDSYTVACEQVQDCTTTIARIYYERWGCAPGVGEYPATWQTRFLQSDCMDSYYGCVTDGNWESSYILACQ